MRASAGRNGPVFTVSSSSSGTINTSGSGLTTGLGVTGVTGVTRRIDDGEEDDTRAMERGEMRWALGQSSRGSAGRGARSRSVEPRGITSDGVPWRRRARSLRHLTMRNAKSVIANKKASMPTMIPMLMRLTRIRTRLVAKASPPPAPARCAP